MLQGLASGEADVRLKDLREGGTEVIYPAEAMVGGKLARLGDRTIDGLAKKMAEQSIENLIKEFAK